MGRALENKVALVTGAASGIGLEIAHRFTAEGARVIRVDRAEDADIRCDVRSATDVEAAFEQAGTVDLLVNAAGIREIGDVYTLEPSVWEDVIAVNLSGTFYCCQSAARRMRESGGGAIVNISSVGGLVGLAHRPAYTAAKHGVVGLMRSLAIELAPDRIRVNSIHPTNVATPLVLNENTFRLFRPDLEEPSEDDVREAFTGLNLLEVPWIEPIDISEAVLYLAADSGRYVTGSLHKVDAGWITK
jgi:NAD(P)-dependent dehydrogenase (short-subunit alcohol dehydrogenase family)